MKKTGTSLVLTLLITALLATPFSAVNTVISPVDQNCEQHYVDLNGGWLEEREGIKILHLNGSYYDMGYQHGFLLKEEIRESMRAQLAFFKDLDFPYERIMEVWEIMDDYLPHEYKEEMQGMADGAELSFEDVSVINTIPAIFNLAYENACSVVSLWGDATADGKLLHVRSFDWELNISDPETGMSLQENIVLIVRTPKVGYASLSITVFSGAISSWDGVNEKGIVVGEDSCMTWDTTLHGISPAFRMRMVLDSASTVYQAIDILTSNRTCGTNFVVSDANLPIGYALEQTANISYVGKWDDPVEGKDPFWKIKDVVRRAPDYLDPACAAVQFDRPRYDPSGLIGFLYLRYGGSWMFMRWQHYCALSDQIERYYGRLDVNMAMTALRKVYTGMSNLLWYWWINIRHFELLAPSLCQWVVCPKTGEMAISIARPDSSAFIEPVHYFNFFELIEADPP